MGHNKRPQYRAEKTASQPPPAPTAAEPNDPQTGKKNASGKSDPSQPKRVWGMVPFERIMAGLTVLALIVAVLTGAIFYLQLNMMKLDQRAWISIEDIKGELEPGKEYKVTFVMRNTGKTPAKHLRVNQEFNPVRKGNNVEFFYTDPWTRAAGIVSPNAVIKQDLFATHGQPLTPEAYEAIMQGDPVVYLYGTVTYDDIFSHHHFLDFCFQIEVKHSHWYYEICTEHNETDDK
jgi:hypothetical protein